MVRYDRHADDKSIDQDSECRRAKPRDFVVGSGEKMKLPNTAIMMRAAEPATQSAVRSVRPAACRSER